MRSNYLPVSKQEVSFNEDKREFLVILQYDNYAIVSAPVGSLKVGERLEFDSGASGVVVRAETSEVRVRITSEDPVKRCFKTKSLLHLDPVPLKLYVPLHSIGVLRAQCMNTKTLTRGLLGWSLYYNDSQLIAEGCDYLAKDRCVIEGEGVWQAGTYKLRVTSFLDLTQPVRRGVRSWILSQPTSGLTAGEYTDKLGSIHLT
jgi:hypothetical protein